MPISERLPAEENIHEGHRQRMREKLTLHGERVFNTYELLEMLLYSVIPCKNTNPVAKNLMKRFSDISGVLSADRDELMSVDGIGAKTADAIVALGEFGAAIMGAKNKTDPKILLGYLEIGRYLVNKLSDKDGYAVFVLLFNSRLERLCFRELYGVDFAYAEVRAEAFVSLAVEMNASAAIIAHTHPYGPAFPTAGDFETNKMINEALANVGVELMEHYVISGSSFTGMMHNLENMFFKNKQAMPADGEEDAELE